jgi:hypothetical protein
MDSAEDEHIGRTVSLESSIPDGELQPHALSEGWEYHEKHIFILTSSGKPVYSLNGDEQELSTTFGFLQAIISIVQDAGDNIVCINAGNRKFVYFMRKSLYFISISSTGESELVLSKQLEFLYNQVLFILTSKIHDVLSQNVGKDIRYSGQPTSFIAPILRSHAHR